LWVIAALFGVSAVLSVCLSACAGAGAPSVPPIDDGAGPTRITVRFDMSMGADASARGVTDVVNGVQLESDPLSMNWDGSVLSGDVRVNNVSTGSTMKDIEARIFSVNPPDVGIGWNDQEWNYKSAAEGLSSSFVNWAFSGSGGADFEFVVEVSWTPVPAKIAWVSDRTGNQEVYVANRDGTNPVNVSNYPDGDDDSPSLSADGSKVAWMCDWEVYVANADGTGVHVNVSSDGDAADDSPSLSADGSKVAWESNRSGDWEVYVASTDGTGAPPVNVSNDSDADDYSPSLSADGSKVAWRSTRSGGSEVYVARTDGTGEIVNVSQDPGGGNESPSLSADGGTVAWQSIPMWDYEVYVAKTDGTGLVNVSSDGAFDGYPSLQGN
jgi:TolB protein